MTDILIGTNPDKPAVVGSINLEASNEEKAKQLPKPSGYRKADETLHYEEVLTTVLFVIELGPDCYKDPARFPTGPWCKKGDFVLVRPNAGTRVIIHGREFRIINDDSVEAVVDEPRGIRRK
jgi:hypothetical protein